VRAALTLAALACTGAAHADFDAASYPPYERCALCHGLFGQSHLPKFPHLAGQKPDYLRAQIEAFLSGARSNDGGQMSAIVTELEPGDIPVVVAWFAQHDPPPPGDPPPDRLGEERARASGCSGCHDAGGPGPAPYLSAQHAGYLAKQMRDFRDGARTHGSTARLHADLFADWDGQIDAVAAYFSSRERAQ